MSRRRAARQGRSSQCPCGEDRPPSPGPALGSSAARPVGRRSAGPMIGADARFPSPRTLSAATPPPRHRSAASSSEESMLMLQLGVAIGFMRVIIVSMLIIPATQLHRLIHHARQAADGGEHAPWLVAASSAPGGSARSQARRSARWAASDHVDFEPRGRIGATQLQRRHRRTDILSARALPDCLRLCHDNHTVEPVRRHVAVISSLGRRSAIPAKSR